MAHGFLTPTPVTGESPLWRQLQKGFEKLLAAKIWPLSKKQDLIYAHVSDIQNLLKSGQQKALTGSSKTPLLGAGKGAAALPGVKPKGLLNPGKAGITKLDEKQIVVGKNPTDIDRKEQKYLGTTDPDVAGGPKTRKGGTFTDIGSTPQTKPLNDTNFFSKAVNEGIDANTGQYLSKEARIAAFQAGKVERNQSQGPAISPDSGADIVAAVNRNTEAIIRLVDTTKEQTKNDSNIAQQQIQAQDTMMSRAAAKSEEAAAEQGSDLSGFLTPERFKRKDREEKEDKQEKGSKLKEFFRGPNPFKQPEGCGCSPILGGPPGGGGGFGGIGVPDFVDQKRKTMGRPSRLGGGASVMRRGGGGKAITRGIAKTFGAGAAKGAAKGFGKMGLKKIPGVGAIAGAAFAAERAMKGDWLGAGGELLSGLAGTIPGIGTGVSTAIDAGLMARDAGLTPFARGGIITQPTQGLVGEAGQEGVFPLEGSRGKKTFLMFGEGVLNAQLDNKKEFAELQSRGLKQYYEREGGFEKMGNVLGDIFKGIGGFLANLGNGLLGGAANAAGMPGGGFASADEQQLTEALIAGEEGMRTKAYKDSEGIWTIGYGQTTLNGRAVKEGDQITKEQALSGFRSNVGSHRQRAINQVGEDRWSKLDPKARAVLTSLAYNYGSIPDAVLPAAKTGSTEDIAKSMDQLYGHNKGVLKGRRQREQSILRGGTSERLDKDFLAGGSLAAQTTGPMVMGGASSGSAAALAETASRLKGLSTNVKETDYGQNGCVYAVNKVFQSAGITPPWGSALYVPTAEEKMISAGWQRVPYNQAAPGDVMVMKDRKSPPQAHIGIMQANGKVLSNSSGKAAMTWEDTIAGYNNYYGGQGVLYRMPGTSVAAASNPPPSNTPPAVASTKHLGKGARRGAATNGGAVAAAPPSAPGPVPAAPAAATNTGNAIMATSSQVAMGTMGLTTGGGSPTIINNYYGGGGQSGGVNGNGVSPGIGMTDTGTSVFQDLRIRSLG